MYCRVLNPKVDGGKCSSSNLLYYKSKVKNKKGKLSLGFKSPSEVSCCLLVFTNGTAVFIYLLPPNINSTEYHVFSKNLSAVITEC